MMNDENKYLSERERKNFLIIEGRTQRNKKKTITLKVLGVLFALLAVLFFFLMRPYQVMATVDEVRMVTDGSSEYEEYTFSYTDRNGTTHIGNGDDDLIYNQDTGKYEYDIKQGRQYPLYISILAPGNYSFSENYAFLILVIALGGLGAGLLIAGFVLRARFLLSIQNVGDLNNDGKINEKDLAVFADNVKQAEEEEKARIKALDYCKYCGSKLDKRTLFCPQCGASRE